MNTLGIPLMVLLVAVSAVGPLSLNGVLPATSQVMVDLSTRYEVAQLVLTVFLFANLVSQLVLGPAADRYGRRPVMLFGLAVFIAGSVMCATASSIEWLLCGRFVQGFGGAVCSFLPRTIVRDVYSQGRAASMIGYMTTAMMVAPMFGPAMGGWITDQYTWRYMYTGFALTGFVLLLWALRFQPETRVESKSERHSFVSSSTTLLRHPGFLACVFMQSGAVGVYYCFLSGGPFIGMVSRGLSASEYGLWFSMVAIGYLSGNLTAGALSERIGVKRMILFGYIPFIAGIALFWLLFPVSHPAALFFPMFLVAYSNGMSLPSMFTIGMSFRPDLAASASGLAGSTQTAFGVVLTLAMGYVLPFADVWMLLLISMSGALGMLGLWLTHRGPIGTISVVHR